MIENCISLIHKKQEKNLREELFRRYMTDAMKVMIESYYAGHNHTIDLPRYKDFDAIVKEYKQPSREENAEEIKSRIITKLRKVERKNGNKRI